MCSYVATLSGHNIYVHASDFAHDLGSLANLHSHSSLPWRPLVRSFLIMDCNPARSSLLHYPFLPSIVPKSVLKPSLPTPLPEAVKPAAANVHTVAFLMTDGDNVQWMLNDWALAANW